MKVLDLDAVRAFVLVADLHSFTRAADALDTTQSAVSLKLKRLEAHLGPLFDAVAAQTSLGRRAQWSLAADALALRFLDAGRQLGDAARGQAEGLALVKAAGSPLRNPKTGYVTVAAGDHWETFRARGGCCLYYRLDPGENCTTCVLRPAAEREQRLRDYLARKHRFEVTA